MRRCRCLERRRRQRVVAFFLPAGDGCDDLARLAAAYACGIVKNHGFADGNKRTALVILDLFLMLNGFELKSAPAENVVTILGVADGTISEEMLADWLQQHVRML